MTLAILSIGTAVPETTLDQEVGLRLAQALNYPTPEQETWLPAIYRGTQINARRYALPGALVTDVLTGTRESGSPFLPSGAPGDRGPTTAQRMEHYAALAPPLALEACRNAIVASGIRPADFTHLVTVSCTGFHAPGIDRALIEGLALRPTVERTHVGFMGCHGALNGLRVATALTGAMPAARVLLCAVELCSLHYYYGWCPDKMVANALFADGAAALVGLPAVRAPGEWRVAATGSCFIPDSADAMTWTIGDNGFEMTLGKNVPRLIAKHLCPWLTDWLAAQGVSLADVRSWAVHPGGPRILSAVEEGLGLAREALAESRAVLAECGNMSSPTVLFVLERLRRKGAAQPCVALGLGPGLAAEAVLFR